MLMNVDIVKSLNMHLVKRPVLNNNSVLYYDIIRHAASYEHTLNNWQISTPAAGGHAIFDCTRCNYRWEIAYDYCNTSKLIEGFMELDGISYEEFIASESKEVRLMDLL